MGLKCAESINTGILSHVIKTPVEVRIFDMHPANCSSRQIYPTSKNLQILCYSASKPKFSYAATYFETFFLIFFEGKKGAVATTSL